MLKVQMLMRDDMIAPWRPHLEAALAEAGLDAELATDHAPEVVDYVIYAPGGGAADLSGYTNTKAVLGLWAGVESIIANETLTQPYARMVDEGLTEGMVEWVTGHVLRHHLGLDAHITRDAPEWRQTAPPLARQRKVAILGLGELGAACAMALTRLNFVVAGWSRSPKSLPGVACFHGDAGLDRVLSEAEIVVLLLPSTPETENTLNARRLALMPVGAVVLNPGRGALIDDEALLAALDSGRLGHATLDTFRVEPLPRDHPFWSHPNVTVTPHIASETRPETASRVVAANIRRVEAGEPLLHQVDKARGY
ncbi:glyoxylate/hydroxypyruvate reductase A [Maritimibacter sp. UBA3975]|uniref:2-hydroxyacid dehydrogenase n=1 Tax=Maritimibacter sp. UBA3975 TaxID=1946833 RepID=UPI000C094C8D|nr:glyoxylate/hydroxypyruvate reductase A [Maritimibacter sp. UBA3975]MAM60404.1 glyoxylate/hydroxypyruvate reductase A [Maritimibacter sp.]|tara:strand:- start:8990 stop:9919 length:930 start_codon:yes stop_codon:yes gene_type:complete